MSLVLQVGDNGQEVRRLREYLCGAGSSLDARYTTWLAKQVREFQATHDLAVDGLAGPQTQRALGIEVLDGLDVSHYQSDGNRPIDWAACRAAGIRWAYIKATEGRTIADAWADRNRAGALGNGVVPGLYHIAHPENNDAATEWEWFRLNAGMRVGWGSRHYCELPPALDIEQWDWRHSATVPERIEWLAEWGMRAADWGGARPVLYVGASFLKHMLQGGDRLVDIYDLWISRYWLARISDPRYTGDWDEWTLWQWTGDGTCDGVDGRVDRNYMAGGQFGRLLGRAA